MSQPPETPRRELPDDFNDSSRHSFCVLPWLHRFINLEGEVQLCCTAEDHPQSYIRTDSGVPVNVTDGLSDEQIGATRHMRDIRKSMLRADWPAACQRCELTERTGGSSRRQAENQRFAHHVSWILENTSNDGNAPVRIASRDFRPGNHCNLRCRMCHPRASKLLLDEWNKVSRRRLRITGKSAQRMLNMDWFQDDRIWQDLRKSSHDLEHLHFAGGEPLIMPEVRKALEMCVESGAAGQIELTFNTNMTRIPRSHRELWPQFKTVNLLCSIDAFDSLNDYIRHPARWSNIDRNLKLLDTEFQELNLGSVVLSATVQIYNIFHLHELVQYACREFRFIRHMPNLIYLSYPDYFNIQYLPDSLKQMAARRLRELCEWMESNGEHAGQNDIESIVSYMEMGRYSEHVMSEFRRITTAYDELRGESISRLVPELAPLMEAPRGTKPGGHVRMLASRGRWLAGKLAGRLFR